MLIDITMCVGCNECQKACKVQNKLSDVEEKKLSPTAYTALSEYEGGVFVRRQCQHCEDPTCVSVCPVGAFTKTPEGPVVYDVEKCIGCRYCMQSCPFQVPRYDWESLNPRIYKCILCADLVKQGMPTACSEACPTGATKFGNRDDLVAEAYERMKAEPGKYVDRIYGQKEVGGTSVLYLSGVPFEQLGFKTTLQQTPLPALTWNVLSKIPNVVAIGGTFLYGIWWITNRRDEVKQYEERMKNNGHDQHDAPGQ